MSQPSMIHICADLHTDGIDIKQCEDGKEPSRLFSCSFNGFNYRCIDHFVQHSCLAHMKECVHRKPSNGSNGCFVEAILDRLSVGHLDRLTGLGNRAALDRKVEELARREAGKAAARDKLVLELQEKSLLPFHTETNDSVVELARFLKSDIDEKLKQRIIGLLKMSAFVMVDLDHFKRFNDTYGHPTGDKLLQQIAGILKDGLKHSDFVGRYGGEEFGIIINDVFPKDLDGIVERLRKNIEEKTEITASFGISHSWKWNFDTGGIGNIIERSDRALYVAKVERNAVVYGA